MEVDYARPESTEVKERMDKRMKREMRVWMPLEHSRITPCLGFAMVDGMPSLISPWAENGNAQDYVTANPNLDRRAMVSGVDGPGDLSMK